MAGLTRPKVRLCARCDGARIAYDTLGLQLGGASAWAVLHMTTRGAKKEV